MKAGFRYLLCVLGISSLGMPSAAAQSNKDPELWLLKKVIHAAVERVRPSVVTVETFGGFRKVLGAKPKRPAPKRPPKDDGKKKKKPLGPIKMPGFIQAQGPSTGLVISKHGWILTSRFALNWDPSTILVTLDDGRKFTATVHGRDESRGIALLKVDATDLPVPELAPVDEVQVGQWAFAVARSFANKSPTVHAGMVSAVHRIQGRAIQCDASTSPANYGGPLVDLEGRVMGLVAPLSPRGDMAGANWYDSGIGFAASLSDITDKIEAMKGGRVFKKGVIGIGTDPSFLGPGARILTVKIRSAANHANLRKKDMILKVDGVAVRHSMHLQDLIGYHVAGDWITLEVKKNRDGSVVDLLVQLDR